MGRKKDCLIRGRKGVCLDDNFSNAFFIFLGVVISSVALGMIISVVTLYIPLTWWSISIALVVTYFGILFTRVGLSR